MKQRICCGLLIVSSVVSTACASISITAPPDQSKGSVAMPTALTVTDSGIVDYGDVMLDNVVVAQGYPPSILMFVEPGSHVLSIMAKDDKWHTDISRSVNFAVSTCPLCYSCPAPKRVNPSFGQCCTNPATTCDWVMAFNFGPSAFGTSDCQKPLFAGSQQTFANQDCLVNPTIDLGVPGSNILAAAVSFLPTGTGALSQIQVPIGVTAGTGSATVFVTADAAGTPGAILETIAVNPVRAQPPLPVVSPMHIFSTTHPSLTAGSRYWLVVAAATGTVLRWNKTVLFDVSTTGMTTLLLSSTNSGAGPWVQKSTLQEIRPAFEIDVQ